MARIAGVDLPREKRVEIGLTYIYGIGLATSKKILAATGINPDTRVKDLDENDVSKLREYIDHKRTRGGRTSQRSFPQYQAPDGNRLLSRHPSQKGAPRPRAEHQEKRAYPQGSRARHRRQEEVIREEKNHGRQQKR